MKAKKLKKKDNKMSKPKTYVTLILDQSGSMFGTKAEAVQGYNEQVQQMKINSKEQDIFCSLITFNGDVFEHQWCVPADELNEASAEDYLTEGSTAMHDAIGYAISKLKKTTEADENTAYLMVIVSDGAENASKHYKNRINGLIKECQDTGKWTFTYMGCDKKEIEKVAAETNIPIANMALWSNASSEMATRGMQRNRKCLDGYYKCRTEGLVASSNVYSADSACLADFTKEDSGALPNVGVVGNVDLSVNHLMNAPQSLNVHVGSTTVGTVSPFSNYNAVNLKV